MGKVLIIKGADFSANAVKTIEPAIEITELERLFLSVSAHAIATRADGYIYYFPVENGASYNLKCTSSGGAVTYSYTEQIPAVGVQFRLNGSQEYGSGTVSTITNPIKSQRGANITAPFNGYVVIATTVSAIVGLTAEKA